MVYVCCACVSVCLCVCVCMCMHICVYKNVLVAVIVTILKHLLWQASVVKELKGICQYSSTWIDTLLSELGWEGKHNLQCKHSLLMPVLFMAFMSTTMYCDYTN